MSVEPATLDGMDLDKAVAIALGYDEQEINARILGVARYSMDWSHAGPIIERDRIQVSPTHAPSDEEMRQHFIGREWMADARGFLNNGAGATSEFLQYGPTPLIAAMRAFVASRR